MNFQCRFLHLFTTTWVSFGPKHAIKPRGTCYVVCMSFFSFSMQQTQCESPPLCHVAVQFPWLDNRRFPETTGVIIQKSEAPAVGHGLLADMISEWRRQSKSVGLWQYQTFRHGPILHWTARWRYALKTLNSFFFSFVFSAYYGLFGGATCGVSVWNGGLTESTASIHYLHRVLD